MGKLLAVFLDRMAAMPARCEHFPHGADIGVRGLGATRAEAFAQAAARRRDHGRGRGPDALQHSHRVQRPQAGAAAGGLLNALIYAMATCNMLFGRSEAQLPSTSLKARPGESASIARAIIRPWR